MDKPPKWFIWIAGRTIARHMACQCTEVMRYDGPVRWKGRSQDMRDDSTKRRWMRMRTRFQRIAKGCSPWACCSISQPVKSPH